MTIISSIKSVLMELDCSIINNLRNRINKKPLASSTISRYRTSFSEIMNEINHSDELKLAELIINVCDSGYNWSTQDSKRETGTGGYQPYKTVYMRVILPFLESKLGTDLIQRIKDFTTEKKKPIAKLNIMINLKKFVDDAGKVPKLEKDVQQAKLEIEESKKHEQIAIENQKQSKLEVAALQKQLAEERSVDKVTLKSLGVRKSTTYSDCATDIIKLKQNKYLMDIAASMERRLHAVIYCDAAKFMNTTTAIVNEFKDSDHVPLLVITEIAKEQASAMRKKLCDYPKGLQPDIINSKIERFVTGRDAAMNKSPSYVDEYQVRAGNNLYFLDITDGIEWDILTYIKTYGGEMVLCTCGSNIPTIANPQLECTIEKILTEYGDYLQVLPDYLIVNDISVVDMCEFKHAAKFMIYKRTDLAKNMMYCHLSFPKP